MGEAPEPSSRLQVHPWGKGDALVLRFAPTGSRRPEFLRKALPASGGQGSNVPWVIRPFPPGDKAVGGCLTTAVNEWWAAAYSLGRVLAVHILSGNMESEFTSADILGDVNGDGHADFVTGCNEAWVEMWDAGSFQVYDGKTGDRLHDQRDYEQGIDVCSPGDLDGDGIPDIAAAYVEDGRIEALSGDGFAKIWL